MPPTTIRSGSGSRLMWLGGVMVFLGGLTALVSTLTMIVHGPLVDMAVWVGIGLLAVAAGVVLFVLARRACARVDARGVSWTTMRGDHCFVPWEHVYRVVVPDMHEPGDAVLLQLRDGSVVPVRSLRKIQGADDNTGPHHWYLRAGHAVVAAHQQWLAQHAPPGR